jgi:hypothetical protein
MMMGMVTARALFWSNKPNPAIVILVVFDGLKSVVLSGGVSDTYVIIIVF